MMSHKHRILSSVCPLEFPVAVVEVVLASQQNKLNLHSYALDVTCSSSKHRAFSTIAQLLETLSPSKSGSGR